MVWFGSRRKTRHRAARLQNVELALWLSMRTALGAPVPFRWMVSIQELPPENASLLIPRALLVTSRPVHPLIMLPDLPTLISMPSRHVALGMVLVVAALTFPSPRVLPRWVPAVELTFGLMMVPVPLCRTRSLLLHLAPRGRGQTPHRFDRRAALELVVALSLSVVTVGIVNVVATVTDVTVAMTPFRTLRAEPLPVCTRPSTRLRDIAYCLCTRSTIRLSLYFDGFASAVMAHSVRGEMTVPLWAPVRRCDLHPSPLR